MTAVSALTNYVDIDGCPGFLIEKSIVDACREFCEVSRYWRYELSPISLIKGRAEYQLQVPDDSAIATVLDPISLNGADIEQRSFDWLNKNLNNWRSITGTPEHVYILSPGLIRVIPSPVVSNMRSLVVTVALKPKVGASVIPDVVVDDYSEEIIAGAKSKLMALPNKEWSDVNLVGLNRSIFEAGIDHAKAKARSGYKTEHRTGRVRPHFM